MILSNTKEASKYLPSLNLTVQNDRLTDFFRRAQEWLTSHIIGTEVEEQLEIDIADNMPDPHEKLRTLCQRVIAEKALLDAAPEMDLQLTEAGFAVQDNDNFSPASQARVDRFISNLPERIKADVDAVVRYLWKKSVPSHRPNDQEEDPNDSQEDQHDRNASDINPYDYWRGSDQFRYLTSCFLPCYEEYTRISLMQNCPNYEGFYASIATMAKEMKKVADYYVSRQEVERLLELYRDEELLEVHRKAISELKDVAVAAGSGDLRRARNAASAARDVMMANPTFFPCFVNSDAAKNTSVNLDGGKTVNFL